jgi:hypothetical protein
MSYVSLGWWKVPKSIVSAKLRQDGKVSFHKVGGEVHMLPSQPACLQINNVIGHYRQSRMTTQSRSSQGICADKVGQNAYQNAN